MSREKQIEKMVDFFKVILPTGAMVGGLPIKITHNYKAYAKILYDEGYRKQSEGEWIAKNPMIRSPFARNYYCSVCKCEPIEAASYCPNCGSNMKCGAE